jgi:hypothetical protein
MRPGGRLCLRGLPRHRFIGEHMLEAKSWAEKIDALQNHVTQLSEAHRSLVKVRNQYQLLLPVET